MDKKALPRETKTDGEGNLPISIYKLESSGF